MMKIRIILIGLTALLSLAAAAWHFWPQRLHSDQAALVELGIDKLTCGSCVENVRGSLAGLPGLGQIEIDVSSGRGRVEYDPQRTDAETIARRISTAGYPSRIVASLSVPEYAALRNRRQDLAGKYVAQIGNRLLSRAEFDTALALRRPSSPGTKIPDPVLQQAVWEDLLQRELLLNAAAAEGVVVQDGEVDLRLDSLRKSHPDFDKVVKERFGSEETLKRQLKSEMLVEKTLRETVLPAGLNAEQQSEFLNRWYAGLVQTTPVTIFDPSLAAAAKAGAGGCGGSCCNKKS